MDIKKVNDKPMVIHTKKKIGLHVKSASKAETRSRAGKERETGEETCTVPRQLRQKRKGSRGSSPKAGSGRRKATGSWQEKSTGSGKNCFMESGVKEWMDMIHRNILV